MHVLTQRGRSGSTALPAWPPAPRPKGPKLPQGTAESPGQGDAQGHTHLTAATATCTSAHRAEGPGVGLRPGLCCFGKETVLKKMSPARPRKWTWLVEREVEADAS